MGHIDHQAGTFTGPSRAMTRNGRRARTPRPRVVWPSKLLAHATWRKVRYPATGSSLADLMAGHRKLADIRGDLDKRPGYEARAAELREQTLEEIRLYELRRARAVSQIEIADRLNITQAAISKFENADDVRISTLRQYLEALGAHLELIAVFDDDHRIPINLGKDAA